MTAGRLRPQWEQRVVNTIRSEGAYNLGGLTIGRPVREQTRPVYEPAPVCQFPADAWADYDPATFTGLADGADITTAFQDSSGNGRDAAVSSFGGAYATWEETVFNGLPAVRAFRASGLISRRFEYLFTETAATHLSLITVFQRVTGNALPGSFVSLTQGDDQALEVFYRTASPGPAVMGYAGSAYPTDSFFAQAVGSDVGTTPTVAVAVRDGTTIRLRVNDDAVVIADEPDLLPTFTDALFVAGFGSSLDSEYLLGRLIAFDRALTTAEEDDAVCAAQRIYGL